MANWVITKALNSSKSWCLAKWQQMTGRLDSICWPKGPRFKSWQKWSWLAKSRSWLQPLNSISVGIWTAGLNICPIWNTYLFLGLHARVSDAPHQSTDEGRSAPFHAKSWHKKGDIYIYIYIHIYTYWHCDYYTESAQWAEWVKNLTYKQHSALLYVCGSRIPWVLSIPLVLVKTN